MEGAVTRKVNFYPKLLKAVMGKYASDGIHIREATGWFFFGGISRQGKNLILCVLRASVVNIFGFK